MEVYFMSKYDRLAAFLTQCGQDTVMLTFSQMEQILGFKLPASAQNHREWWGNGGHSQANAWLSVGYKVDHVAQDSHWVRFIRSDVKVIIKQTPSLPERKPTPHYSPSTATLPPAKTLNVCGKEFMYAQSLIPLLENGRPKEFHPEKFYDNQDRLPLLYHGRGPFCRFSVDLPSVSGVYLWVVGDEIIYIGEAVDLNRRFNSGYGNISPRNCYQGGQSTNCKMNKAVLQYFQAGTPVKLYIHPTKQYKELELQLLRSIYTKYNVKDN